MARRDRYEEDPEPDPPRYRLLDGLQVVFGVMAGLGLFFYLQGPARNEVHALFRLAIVGIGGFGLVAVTVLRLTLPKRP